MIDNKFCSWYASRHEVQNERHTMPPAAKESKTLYHSSLVQMGDVDVEVLKEPQKSKYEGKPDYVVLKIDGKERLYNVENDSCAAFFDGQAGVSMVIRASGSREDAIIEFIDDAPPPTDTPPRAPARAPARSAAPPPTRQPPARQTAPQGRPAPAAAPSQRTGPRGETVGMAMNCAIRLEVAEIAKGAQYDKERIAMRVSDLLRIAAWHERGNLVPKLPSTPQAAAEPEPPAELPPETEVPLGDPEVPF